jgi:hypothetical protein
MNITNEQLRAIIEKSFDEGPNFHRLPTLKAFDLLVTRAAEADALNHLCDQRFDEIAKLGTELNKLAGQKRAAFYVDPIFVEIARRGGMESINAKVYQKPTGDATQAIDFIIEPVLDLDQKRDSSTFASKAKDVEFVPDDYGPRGQSQSPEAERAASVYFMTGGKTAELPSLDAVRESQIDRIALVMEKAFLTYVPREPNAGAFDAAARAIYATLGLSSATDKPAACSERTNVGSDGLSDQDRAAMRADLEAQVDSGECESCIGGKCVTGDKCVTLGRDSTDSQAHDKAAQEPEKPSSMLAMDAAMYGGNWPALQQASEQRAAVDASEELQRYADDNMLTLEEAADQMRAPQSAPVGLTEALQHIEWLHYCLRDSGYCIDGGKCHHKCGSKGDCWRKEKGGCVPLSGANLTDDWQLLAAHSVTKAESDGVKE